MPARHAFFRAPRRASFSAVAVAAVIAGSVSIAAPAQAAPAQPSGPKDASSAADGATAKEIARRYHHAVTDLSSLTEKTKVEALPDGTQRLTTSAMPQRVRKGNKWVDIDTTLAKSGNMLAPAAAPVPVEFSGGGSGPLARVQTSSGKWISVASPVSALPDGVVDGNSVTYPDVFPGVDLKLTATVAGMSEVLVINDAAAASDPRLSSLQFGVSGASVAADRADGSAKATVSDGSAVVSPTPMWWDSSDGGTADGPGGAGITRPVKGGAAGSAVVVDAGDAARTPGVKYPLFVDPDFTGLTQGWTFVDAAYPSSSYWMGNNHQPDPVPHVGYITAAYSGDGRNHTDRSFWQLDTSMLPGKHILSAQFQTTETYSSACTNNSYSLWITEGISPSTTWYSQPAQDQRVSGATLGPAGRSCSIPLTGSVGFDAYGVAQWASQRGNSFMVVGMYADNEGDLTSWRKFSGGQMIVTYNTPPYAPSSPTTATQACAGSPGPVLVDSAVSQIALSVSAYDADPGNVGVIFTVADPNGNNVLPASSYPNGWIDAGMHAQGTFTGYLPTSLPDGSYRWNARTYDGTDWSPTYSALCYFQIHNAPPTAPVVTPSTPTTATLTVGTPLTITVGQGASNDGVVGFAYTWQSSTGAPTYNTLPACSNDAESGGLHYVCGSSATIQTAPSDSPQAQLRVWAFNAASSKSTATTLTWSSLAQTNDSLYPSSHQWTTDLAGPVPAAQCLSGTTTVSCVADNNVPDPNQPNGQYPITIPAGVTLGDSSATPAAAAVTFVAGATAENSGMQTVTLTVPAGVTTADFGVVTVATAESGNAAGATLPGWTPRDDQPHPAGESTSSSYIFTRLGGQKAGDVLTVTMPQNAGATIAGAWYDTGGRDVQSVGPLWDTNATNQTAVTWPAPSYTGTADVLLVAASRTAGGPSLGTPSGATVDYQRFITTTWNAGGIFGHAQNVTPTTFSATWNGGVASHNVNALQLVLANPAPPAATGGPAGVLTFGSASTTPMISSAASIVDTTKSFTVGAWVTPTAANGLAQTAVSERGQTYSGFELQLNAAKQWCFVVHSTTATSSGQAVASSPASLGTAVYVAGVWDAVNHELRLYVNGSLAANQTFWPTDTVTAAQGITIGSAWSNGAATNFWNGQIANPVVVQGVLTSFQISELADGSFFPSLG